MRIPVVLPALVLLLASCGGTTQGYTPDTSTDGWLDGDGTGDVPVDTTPDSLPDSLPDVPHDTLPDAPPDTIPDMPPDVPPDTHLDSPPDMPPDTHPDSPPDMPPDIPPDGPTGIVGDACSSAAQCAAVPGSGRTCVTTLFGMIEFPNGYCSATCTSSSDCGASGSCVSLYGYGSYCLRSCTTSSQCRTWDGYSCSTLPSTPGMYCLPPISGPDGGPVDP